ncbi:MAG: AMP-binding protein [Novosphingobium sp.]
MPNLFRAFAQSAHGNAARTALRDDGRNRTYTDLHGEARQAGRALLAMGIGKGDRVAIWAVNHAEWVIAALGIQAVGAVLVLIGTRLKGAEASDILQRSGACALFMDASVAGYNLPDSIAGYELPELRQRIEFGSGWRAFMATGDAVSEEALDQNIAAITADDTADIIFTSGTTGKPKGVPMTHAQSLTACAQQQACVTQFIAGETFAVFYPFAHNAGYRAGWQAGLLNGARIIPVRDYNPGAILDLIERERVAVLPMVPTLFQSLLDDPSLPHRDLSSLRFAGTGAATIPVQLITRMRTELGSCLVSTGYGLTEAAGSVSNTRPGDSDEVIATTTGLPLDNLEVRILDAEHREVPAGTPGEIAVRGFQVMRGYYQDAEASAKAFTRDGFLLTGDVGLFTPQGHLRITDRLKDMYLCGGFNCYPAEIEAILRGNEAVAEVAVVGMDDDRLEQVGRAFITARPGYRLTEAAMIAWSRDHMANYKVPRSVVVVDALPLNGTGKVDKVQLRNWSQA